MFSLADFGVENEKLGHELAPIHF